MSKPFLPELPYQAALFLRLHAGLEKRDRRDREKIAAFILSAQCGDGGFRGRRSDADEGDLYYTSFALRGLLLLGSLDDPALCRSVGGFLLRHRDRITTAADLFSFTFCLSLVGGVGDEEERKAAILRHWRLFQRPDGCYASSENTRYSSTYTTFLAAGAFEILEAVAEKNAVAVEPILRRQRRDGGFVELEPLRQSGTNPTAAAVAFLKMYGLEPTNRREAADFLLERQVPEGGFQANTKIPVADLLSSFTAMVALVDLEAENRCDRAALGRFAASLRTTDGGYRGASWDRQSDVEYTFYGLALESLLAGPADRRR